MAKKFVRGITNVNEINKQDFDTNNVNDLLSDGEHNYIHRKKKDKSEEYHNLTNNLKTLSSSDGNLLTVTNYNNSTNSAVLHPHHDAQKEQVIESTRNTINIDYGENGTDETTKVDTNPQVVLEHGNLTTTHGILKVTHKAGTNTSVIDEKGLHATLDQTAKDIASLEQKDDHLEATKQDKLTAANTQTVNMSLISNTVSSNVNISDNEDNILTIENNGLYVPSTTTTTFSDSALEGEHLDLSNYVLPNTVTTFNTWYGKALTKHPILDVVFETQDSTGITNRYETRALYKITDTNKIEINLTTITSTLLAKNLTNVLSFTTL